MFSALVLGAAVVFYIFFPHVWGEALFPYPYKDIYLSAVENERKRCPDLPVNLPVAVGYVESGHNPRAQSRAGAGGVMQLIYGTAAGLAKELGVSNFSHDLIYDPDFNIRAGTRYLCNLWNNSKGELSMTLARYNFGPRAANRDVWPRETQNFDRRVRSVLDAYNKLYPNGQEATPFTVKTQSSFLSALSPKTIFNVLLGQ